MRALRAAALAAALSLGLGSPAGALTVVASFQPLYDVLTRVAGPGVQVERMAPAGSSPHTFDPTVRDIHRLREAALAVMAGLGADSWLDRYVRASGSRARVLKLGETITFAKLRVGAATDPHWWLDASLMAQAALRMGADLAAVDPANADRYARNARREAQALNALHGELRRTLAPVRGEKLVTFHNAFGYFARAYGLEVAATIAPLHGVEPSVQSMVRAVQVIRASGARAVFSEPQLPPGPAGTVAREAGVPLYTLDPEGGPAAPTYPQMMRLNRDTLLRALR